MKINYPRRQQGARSISSLVALLVGLGVAFSATPAIAATQSGGDMTNINSLGGADSGGADGIQMVFNSEDNYPFPTVSPGWGSTLWSTGSDWLVFQNAFFFNTVLPNLAIGTTAHNSGAWGGTHTNWTSVATDSGSGSASLIPAGSIVPPSPALSGDAEVHYSYVATQNSLQYTVDRYISYVYPNAYWDERIVVTIPDGNTEDVAYWYGGDVNPAENDSAYGVSTALPLNSYYSFSTTGNAYIGFIETSETSRFDGVWVKDITAIADRFKLSTPFGVTVDSAAPRDAGMQFQFAFGSTPGTYERQVRISAGNGGPQLGFSLDKTEMKHSNVATLQASLINFSTTDSNGLSFVMPLPAGMTLASVPDVTDCGATSDSQVGDTALDVSVIDLVSFASCYIEVSVSAVAGTYVIADQDAVTDGGLVAGTNMSTLTVTGETLAPTGAAPVPYLGLTVAFVAGGLVIVMLRRRRAA